MLRLSPPDNERIVRGETFQKQVGGAELNVVSGAALLGLRTGIISKLPDNSLGIYAKNRVRFCGVSDDYLVYDKEEDARLGIYFYENGAYPRKPSVVYDRRHASFCKINETEVPDSMYANTACFHTSGITLALSENTREVAIDMIKKFKAQGALISFDVNFRGNLWTGEEAKECIERILPYVDIFFCSEDTARLTFLKEGNVKEDYEEFYRKSIRFQLWHLLRELYTDPKCIPLVQSSTVTKEDKYFEEEPYRDIEVVDRIGSGDAYCSGVLYGLLREDGGCASALRYGNASSAAKNTIPGDMPSLDREEIENIIHDHETVGYHSEMNR